MLINKTIKLKDIAEPEPDKRAQFIKSNSKNIPYELQLMLVDIQTKFATFLLSPDCNLPYKEIEHFWALVRNIFGQYGLE